jgi:hypothetical protein
MSFARGVAVCLLVSGFAVAEPEQPSPALRRAVEEFKLQTRNLGLRPDSPAKSRKNGQRAKYHGRLFDNVRNDIFDAVPHEIVQRGGTKSLLRRNQFGFNIAGPLTIPKLYDGGRSTFFSFSFEGVRERISRSYLRTIPTAGEKIGDFSATVDSSGDPLPIFDPLTTRANPAYDPSQPVSTENLEFLRDPFPGNRIPAERLDRVARNTASLYPESNATVGPFLRNNYFAISPERNTANGMILKVDHTVSPRHRLEFASAISNGSAASAKILSGVIDPSAPDREFRSRRGALEHVFTLSPRTVSTVAFEAETDQNRNAADAVPVYRFGAYVPAGKVNPNGRYARHNYTLSHGLSAKRGRHSLRTGLWHSLQQVTSYYDWYPLGSYQFTAGLTSLPGIVNTGHPFASFLLGTAESAELTRVLSPSYFRRSTTSLSVRDQVELTENLTVNVAVSVEVLTPRVEKYDRQSTVSFDAVNPANGAPGALIAAKEGDCGRAFRPVRVTFQPTLGVAWKPGAQGRTVLRAEVARRSYAMPIGGGQFGTQGFNGSPTWISQNSQLEPAVVMSQGLPEVPPLPDLRPDAVNNMVADYIEPSGRLPEVRSASVAFERELPGSAVVTVGLAHAQGRDMLTGNNAVDLNAIPLDALDYRDQLNNESFRRSLRPYPQYLGFDLNGLYPAGRYQRDAAYMRLEKRTSRGLSLSAYYEYAKQLDDYAGGLQDFLHREKEWGRTPGVAPHRFSMSYVYELPFGPGKPLLAWNGWRRYLVEGWSFSGMTGVSSGDPLTLRPQFNNTGGVVRYLYVNSVPGVDARVEDQGPQAWFNPAAFAQPDSFAIGNLGRTHPWLLAPGSQNHDLSMTKRFSLAADRSVEFSAVAFNFINHANWTDPDTVIGPESAPNVNAGRIIGSVGGRVIQVGLRYSF